MPSFGSLFSEPLPSPPLTWQSACFVTWPFPFARHAHGKVIQSNNDFSFGLEIRQKLCSCEMQPILKLTYCKSLMIEKFCNLLWFVFCAANRIANRRDDTGQNGVHLESEGKESWQTLCLVQANMWCPSAFLTHHLIFHSQTLPSGMQSLEIIT